MVVTGDPDRIVRPRTAGDGADKAAPPAIALQGVGKRFGVVEAVRKVDLTIAAGQIVALLGPNGAGKTTTIDMVLGLAAPTSGTVAVYGMAPQQAVRRGLVAAVLQAGGLLHDLTVKETVQYVACLYPHPRPVDEVMERAGLTSLAHRKVGKCSGGEQQRVRFALALLPDPDLLLLDEPTQGMDVETRRNFWQAIRVDAQRGRTVVFATHYLEEADAYADRIVLMRQGAVVADGSAAEIKSLAAGRTVRATLPGAKPEDLQSIAGAERVEVRGSTVLIHAVDSDAVARYLLTQTPACNVEIAAQGLEEAFLALTAEGSPLEGERA